MRRVVFVTLASFAPVAAFAQPAPAPDKVYDLKLSIVEINILRTGLMELPAKQIVGVLNDINNQVDKQSKVTVTPDAPPSEPPK